MQESDNIKELTEIPKELLEIPKPPEKLYIRGKLPPDEYMRLCVVGARRYTPYGKEVCRKLILGLRDYPVTIVSGLAMGIDSIAHESALEANLPTIAIPGSGISNKVFFISSNKPLLSKKNYPKWWRTFKRI